MLKRKIDGQLSFDISNLLPDRAADGKAKNPKIYLDSVFEKECEEWKRKKKGGRKLNRLVRGKKLNRLVR